MAIVGYIGGIGTGKTLNAAREAIELAIARSRPGAPSILVSNIRLRIEDRYTVNRPVEVVQLAVGRDGIDTDGLTALVESAQECSVCEVRDKFGDVLHLRQPGCQQRAVTILLDEVGILMPARFWQDFPIDLMMELSQSRKGGVEFRYTAQDVEQVDAILRRLSNWVWLCKSFPVSSIMGYESGRHPWLFTLTKWKVKAIEGQRIKPIGRRIRLWSWRWAESYNTRERVKPPAVFRDRQARRREKADRTRPQDAGDPGAAGVASGASGHGFTAA